MSGKKQVKKQDPKKKEEKQAKAPTTESSSSPKVTYIVNGTRVDPDGNPVED